MPRGRGELGCRCAHEGIARKIGLSALREGLTITAKPTHSHGQNAPSLMPANAVWGIQMGTRFGGFGRAIPVYTQPSPPKKLSITMHFPRPALIKLELK